MIERDRKRKREQRERVRESERERVRERNVVHSFHHQSPSLGSSFASPKNIQFLREIDVLLSFLFICFYDV